MKKIIIIFIFIASITAKAQIPCSVTIVSFPLSSGCDSLVALVQDSFICAPWSAMWSPGNEIGLSIIVCASGTYTITVLNNGTGGCCGSMWDSITAFVNPTLIENNYSGNSPLNLYPNPATTEIVVESGAREIVALEVWDVVGERVLSHPQPPLSNTMANAQRGLRIDVSSLRAGIYFVSLTDEKGNRAVRKVVKM